MSDNLSNFLVDLASDPATMEAFLSNPSAVLDQVGAQRGREGSRC